MNLDSVEIRGGGGEGVIETGWANEMSNTSKSTHSLIMTETQAR